MNKIRSVILVLAFLCLTVNGYATGVDQDELKSTSDKVIVFENYTGPHTVVNTLDEIKDIGTQLGRVISSKVDTSTTAGNQNKYFVIHAVDSSEKDKLDADILILGSDASVDHIRNLRHIIASYLISTYSYSETDAETIASFITVYNAVYRGDLETYSSKYKSIVLKNLTSEKVGLSTSYKEWAGKSQIVIPLLDLSGGLSTIDTSVISDKNVVKSMQDDDDKNIDDRKNMVDIKEREAETSEKKAQESSKKAVKEEEALEESKKDLTQKKQEAAKAQTDAEKANKEAEQAQKNAAENPNDKEAQKKAVETTKEAEKKNQESQKASEEVKKQETKVTEQQQKTDEAKKTATEEQSKADKKTNEAQEERKEIAKDQAQVIKETNAQNTASKTYGIKLIDSKTLTSGLIVLNADSGELLTESPVKVIRNRNIYETANGFIAIAGENRNNATVKLVIISKDTLEITSESKETVAENSVLVKEGSSYYCVISEGSNWVIAKYNEDLSLSLKSTQKVKPETPITISSSGIIVTDDKGKAVLLNTKDLSRLSK